MEDYILENFSSALETFQNIQKDINILNQIKSISKVCCECLSRGNKIILAGNGGSACDAQHIAGELVGRYKLERRGLSAISLNDNVSIITSISNDYGYEYIFSRQLEAIAKTGDIFIVFTTSGNSKNIITAAKTAKKMNIKTIGFTGINKGKVNKYCEYLVEVPNKETARIQEGHILIGHIICGLIEKNFCH